ncbi:MAG: hypothetical protein ACYC0V_07480 [Armatimonadota bacterium]
MQLIISGSYAPQFGLLIIPVEMYRETHFPIPKSSRDGAADCGAGFQPASAKRYNACPQSDIAEYAGKMPAPQLHHERAPGIPTR